MMLLWLALGLLAGILAGVGLALYLMKDAWKDS